MGRRILKETQDTCYRYAWDGNVLLHEWSYSRQDKPRVLTDDLGRTSYDREELHTNLITWVYDGSSYTPVAKLTEEDSYTIVQDYLGMPIQALDSKGEVVWDCLLDIYGDVLTLRGERSFVPFRFQGQYEDEETGLYYNRFRYYSPQSGNYISQDPIRLEGGLSFYSYVHDVNSFVDIFGLFAKINLKSKAPIDLGDSYRARKDVFNYKGEADFEVHVYKVRSNNTLVEVGIMNSDGTWKAKHGLDATKPSLPENASKKLTTMCKK